MSPFGREGFFTVEEVSKLLKLSVITLYKYIRERKLEAIEFGGHYRISSSSLSRFIEQHTIKKWRKKNS